MISELKHMSVLSLDKLKFEDYKGAVKVTKLDWFTLLQARVYYYPKDNNIELHTLSGEILLVVLKGKVEFKEEDDDDAEIAGPGDFRQCAVGAIPWTTTILEDSYILVIEKEDTETVYVKENKDNLLAAPPKTISLFPAVTT